MSVLGGRGGRSDDWSTPHLRAQASGVGTAATRHSTQRRGAGWTTTSQAVRLCRTAVDYATQHLELRALRDRAPQPPRDLWARTGGVHRARGRPSFFRHAQAVGPIDSRSIRPPRRCTGRGDRRRDAVLLPASRRADGHARCVGTDQRLDGVALRRRDSARRRQQGSQLPEPGPQRRVHPQHDDGLGGLRRGCRHMRDD